MKFAEFQEFSSQRLIVGGSDGGDKGKETPVTESPIGVDNDDEDDERGGDG